MGFTILIGFILLDKKELDMLYKILIRKIKEIRKIRRDT